jgi:hypothetical protein
VVSVIMRAKTQTEVTLDPLIWEMGLQEFRGNSSQRAFYRITTYLQEEFKHTIDRRMRFIAPTVGLPSPMVFSSLR